MMYDSLSPVDTPIKNGNSKRTFCRKAFLLLSICLIAINMSAQEAESFDVENTIYIHQEKASTQSKVIQKGLRVIGMRRSMEKQILESTGSKTPARIPRSLRRKCLVESAEHLGKQVWTISRKKGQTEKSTETVVLFFHGGAYYLNLSSQHWKLIEEMVIAFDVTFVVPDYPLAPEADCATVYEFSMALYANMVTKYADSKIILMGDSAGGGIALGMAQKLVAQDVKQADNIILFSPWLDVTMTNPEIAEIEDHDVILSVQGLKHAGKTYARSLALTDPAVSPLYGSCDGVGHLSIFIGTSDVLYPDVRKFRL